MPPSLTQLLAEAHTEREALQAEYAAMAGRLTNAEERVKRLLDENAEQQEAKGTSAP